MWAHKILKPKARMEKLGVKEGAKVTVIGKLEAEFEAELKKVAPDFARGTIAKDTEFIFLTAETEKELARATNIARVMRGATALWIVYPKGRRDIAESGGTSIGRKAGLNDGEDIGCAPTASALQIE